MFFKVFDRVSWWSFRVSKPFSILSLILLNHIHKNAVFRPNILNYLNTAFTFGKRTKDTFINRTIQYVYEFTDSLIFVPTFLGGRVMGAAAPTEPEIPHDQQQSQMVPLAPHQDGTKKVQRCSYATWSLDKLWAAFPCV